MLDGDHHLVRPLSAPEITNRWVIPSHPTLYQMGLVHVVAQRATKALVP